MGLAEGHEEKKGRVPAVVPYVLVHHAYGLGGRPGRHVEFLGKYAGTGRVPIVGHARVEQAEVAPALFGKPVQVIVAVSG